MPHRDNSLSFVVSPRFVNGTSYSDNWPSKDRPACDPGKDFNVAVDVLKNFKIPFIGQEPPRGNLCGLDINNMPAIDAIKLSLAENIVDGEIYEIYTDAYGNAYFQPIYKNPKTISLDIRLCVPSEDIATEVDGVIVRGYDKPPIRSFKEFVPVIKRNTGSLNPAGSLGVQSYHNFDSLVAENYCQGRIFSKEASVSYADPVLETAYGDQIDNLYNLNAFESLSGYVINFNGSTDPTVKYSFSDTSSIDIPINLSNASLLTESACTEEGIQTVSYRKMTASIPSYRVTDKYGDVWPLLNSISQISVIGYKVESLVDYTAFPGGSVVCYISPTREVFSLSAGTNWYWELKPDSSAEVNVYYPLGESGSLTEYIATLLSYSNIEVRLMGSGSTTGSNVAGTPIPNLGGTMGVIAQYVIATLEIDRPSATIQHQGGNALSFTRNLHVEYQPIIITDEPPPVAYVLSSGQSGLVNHTLDLFDSDPATVEINPEERVGSLNWLQNTAQGNIIDVSLPFLSESDCLLFANKLYEMYQHETTIYNLVCGPESEPELGAKVEGLDGRINSIDYSYQDGSSYNINVTVGPTLENIGSWSNQIWQKKTSDVSREAIVVWTAGDGINYVVRIRGMGVYSAINTTLAAYAPGEKVSVTIHNNPDEV